MIVDAEASTLAMDPPLALRRPIPRITAAARMIVAGSLSARTSPRAAAPAIAAMTNAPPATPTNRRSRFTRARSVTSSASLVSCDATRNARSRSVSRTGESADKSSWTIHVGPMGVFDDKVDYDWDYAELAEAEGGRVSFDNTDWLGFTDHYWLTALIPAKPAETRGYFLHSEKGDIFNVRTQSATASIVQPGETLSTQSRLFAGAKEVEVLNGYQNDLGIEKFSLAIDWGWFRPIEIFFFNILSWLFDVTGNFGVAIICLTIIVRLILFPVANKQFASMAAMRAIQPKQKALQEKYKDDKQKQQQEMMKLFKEEKVNPLAGCLPIFLQIPIFYALYKLLMLSIDMRHQPFALWIKDLSAPDPLTPVNLFGLLPFDPPTFLHIGVLAILVGLTMWLQQRLNPAPADPIQKQVFAIMPWALMFILAPFAAGLQLYWATNNILSIGQQKLLYMRHPKMREAIAKEAEDRKRAEEEKKAEPTKKGRGKAGA